MIKTNPASKLMLLAYKKTKDLQTKNNEDFPRKRKAENI